MNQQKTLRPQTNPYFIANWDLFEVSVFMDLFIWKAVTDRERESSYSSCFILHTPGRGRPKPRARKSSIWAIDAACQAYQLDSVSEAGMRLDPRHTDRGYCGPKRWRDPLPTTPVLSTDVWQRCQVDSRRWRNSLSTNDTGAIRKLYTNNGFTLLLPSAQTSKK